MKIMIRRMLANAKFLRAVWRFTTADDEHGLAGEYTEPYSRAQIDRMAAEQGVRFPHSHGPHTIG